MRILIAGVDGYLGWSLANYLAARGHEVGGIDNFFRRRWVEEVGGWSAIPIASMRRRLLAFSECHRSELKFWRGDLRGYRLVEGVLDQFSPRPSSTWGNVRLRPTR